MMNYIIAEKVCEKIVLTKQSSEKQIKMYFNGILELSKSNEKFPVNLDDVWMLVYSERSKAVRALKDNFIENIDYQPHAQNGNRSSDGKFTFGNQTDYFLSLSCLEFFIARKVRAVFEVYRQVFHKIALPQYQVNTTTQPKTIQLKDQMAWIKEVSKVLKLNDASTLGLYQKVAEPYGKQLPLPDYTPSKGVLKSASELLKANNISMSAHQFNIAMMKAGYIEEQTRKSNGGKEKRFKSITKKGLEFGENQVSPHNPLETQPLYYVDKFVALVNKLQLN